MLNSHRQTHIHTPIRVVQCSASTNTESVALRLRDASTAPDHGDAHQPQDPQAPHPQPLQPLPSHPTAPLFSPLPSLAVMQDMVLSMLDAATSPPTAPTTRTAVPPLDPHRRARLRHVYARVVQQVCGMH